MLSSMMQTRLLPLGGRATLAACLVALSINLQGCDLPHIEGYFPIATMDVTTHKVAMWRQKEEVYMKFSYKAPDGKQKFNSCMDPGVSAQAVCNTHGFCSPFDRNNIVKPVFFCRCDMGWAGPECNVKQKSQMVAWLLSLVFGFLGVDQLYLGWTFWTAMKLFGFFCGIMLHLLNFTRCGQLLVLVYWFCDIVHIGSAPVRAVDAKVAADLPRWGFAVFTLLYFAFIGFFMGVCSVYWKVKLKRRMEDHARYYGTASSVNHKVV